MSETVTLELPAELVHQARAIAAANNRRLDDAVADWIGRAVADRAADATPLPSLDPDAVLARLQRIADLPDEGRADSDVTGRDHDRILYGSPGGAR